MCAIAKDSVQDGVRTGHTRTPKVRCQSLEKVRRCCRKIAIYGGLNEAAEDSKIIAGAKDQTNLIPAYSKETIRINISSMLLGNS